MQVTYLPDFIDHDTFLFIEKIAYMESRIDHLKQLEKTGVEEESNRNLGSTRGSPILKLDIDHEEDGQSARDYLKRERKEITNLLKGTTYGFGQTKKKNNEEILRRVGLDSFNSTKRRSKTLNEKHFKYTSSKEFHKARGNLRK